MDRHERAFWNRLRILFSPKVFMRRVENGVNDGDPDVFLMKAGKPIWIELKWAELPVKRTSKLLKKGAMRTDQVNWHLEYDWKGGTSYILIGTNEKDYLLPGKIADQLTDMSLDEIEAAAILAAHSIGGKLEEVLWG